MEWGGRARAYIRPTRGHLPTAELKPAEKSEDGRRRGNRRPPRQHRAKGASMCTLLRNRWGPSVVADLLGRSPAPVLRHATHYAAAQRRKRGPRTPRKLKQQNSKTSDS